MAGESVAEGVAELASDGGDRGVAPGESLVRNVILVSLDTLRRDRLDVYGARRSTSPNLQAFAQRSVVFEDARAQSAQTAPSHASLFTSQHPAVHRVINVHGANPKVHRLPDGLPTLAELVRDAGIETAAFVSGGNLSRRQGMDRGFSVWDERLEDISDRMDAALRWIFAPDRQGGRFLALIHTYQVHAPYLPPADVYPQFVDPSYAGPLRSRLEKYLGQSTREAWEAAVGPEYWDGILDFTDADVRFLSDLYDAEIAYVDTQLRRLFEYVLKSELARDTAIVIFADHGEEFREHGKFQHDQVFDELLRIPLIIRFPGPLEREGYKGRVSDPVALLDVGPTVADMLGVPWPEEQRAGRSLLDLVGPERRGWQPRPILSELVVDPGPKTYRSIVWQGWKYIHAWQADIDHTWEWLFHLQADPREQSNLIASSDPDAQRALRVLREQLDRHVRESEFLIRGIEAGDVAELDPADEALMRQLGYIGADTEPRGPGRADTESTGTSPGGPSGPSGTGALDGHPAPASPTGSSEDTDPR